eukprot:TRINITY_DN19649_c1_g1_i3.p1 TRINITY_DN19649_c1_g1~~TRINITY_DN19649_c1_g1_i3.p1  ORF type:complete len:367 (+),score=46.20 TRINITY_DN19649_c1_g1_i3:71-1171(+)
MGSRSSPLNKRKAQNAARNKRSRKSSSPAGKSNTITISCSLLGDEWKNLLKEAMKKIGGVTITKEVEGSRCLVAGGERGMKKFYAKVMGIPVVDGEWVKKCLEEGRWVSTGNGDEDLAKKLRKILENEVFCIGEDTRCPKRDLEELIRLHGGSLTGTPTYTITLENEKQFFDSLQDCRRFSLTPAKQPNTVNTPAPPPRLAGTSQSGVTVSQSSADLLGCGNAPTAPKSKPPALVLLRKEAAPSVPALIILNKEKVTVGRPSKHSSADIIIDSVLIKNMISRKHATFTTVPTPPPLAADTPPWSVTLTDEGSTNGFFVNGIKRKQCTLVDKDIVTLGGGGEIEPGYKADEINSDCVYQFHAWGISG